MNLLQTLDYYANRYWYEHGDPRFNQTLLMSGGPGKMLMITMTYLIGVTIFGPHIMQKKRPMENLIWPIRAYNAFMVLFNAYLYISFSLRVNWGLDCWGCGVAMKRVDEQLLHIWELTLLSRYFDFFDSVFFVCRKKFDHLSVLHVAHHTLVPIIVWFAGKLEPTPMILFAGYINLPIHVIMYSYYCLSTFPNLRKYLWWKKYLTTIQIIQFCIDLAHSAQIIFLPHCKFHTMTYIQMVFSVTFLYLFGQFYLRSYRSPPASLKQDSCAKSAANGKHIEPAESNPQLVDKKSQ